MKKFLHIFFCFFSIYVCLAQAYEGKIRTSSESGLYRILLSPEIRSASQNNTAHIRIYDAQKNEVPYLLFDRNSIETQWKRLEIVSKESVADQKTSVVISNEDRINWDQIILKIGNSEQMKRYNISGSNDGKSWFGLVNNQEVKNLSDKKNTFVKKYFSFPLNDYAFLKIDFIDKNSLPINIIEAGIEASSPSKSELIQIRNLKKKILTEKKERKTYVYIDFQTPQVIDQLSFQINSPTHFVRSARILEEKTRKKGKNEEKYWEELYRLTLNSKSDNHYSLPNLWVRKALIEIDNQDSPPLKIENITFSQQAVYLLAELNSNTEYTLGVNPQWHAPTYDLASAEINFSQTFPLATIDAFHEIDRQIQREKDTAFWETSLFMWGCILIALFTIGIFSWRMIKDIEKEK